MKKRFVSILLVAASADGAFQKQGTVFQNGSNFTCAESAGSDDARL